MTLQTGVFLIVLLITENTVVHRPPDIAPQNNENESRFDNGAFTQGNVSNNFSIIPLSISKSKTYF